MKRGGIILFLLLLTVTCFAQQFTGRAVSVADGDTFTLLQPDNTTIRVRLYGIDCPEKGQDFANVAKEFTKDFLKGKTVIVQQKDIDRYGRVVAVVFCEGKKLPLNEALLKAGLAWHYAYYDNNPKWAALSQSAKDGGKGLWQQGSAIAPWEFRKMKHANHQ